QHGLGVVGAEHLGDAAVLVAKGGGVFLVLVQIAHVGPQVDVARARFELALGGVVPPAAVGAVAGGSEPALVAAQDLAGQAGGIHALDRRAIVGVHRGDHGVTGRAWLLRGWSTRFSV